MPLGTAAKIASNLPSEPYVVDETGQVFSGQTIKNVVTPKSISAPGPGNFEPMSLLQTGIVSRLKITFDGTLTVATAAVTTGPEYPYRLLDPFGLSVNGMNDLWSCNGCDLVALRQVRHPAFEDQVDDYPAAGSIAIGSYPLHLTWDVPIAMDEFSLVGALYAQSPQSNIVARIGQALMADLFSANPTDATITGSFSLTEEYFEVPYDNQGRLIIPDLSMLHAFNVTTPPLVQVGENRLLLVRSAGQLERLFISAINNGAFLSALPATADTSKIDAVRLEYAGNKRPLNFNPASLLSAINNEHYGNLPSYDRLVLDTVADNAVRDAIVMAGLTELALVLTVDNAVVLSAATARLAQETLY